MRQMYEVVLGHIYLPKWVGPIWRTHFIVPKILLFWIIFKKIQDGGFEQLGD